MDTPGPQAPATLLAFAAANDAAMATRSKLVKQATLGEYFRTLDDDDLRLAVRYANGRAFPATDARTLSVGGRHVSEALLTLLKLDPGAYHDLVVSSGEIGEALTQVWPAGGFLPAGEMPAPLMLRDLAAAFDMLASTGNVVRKRALLVELFTRCATGREATYAAKIMSGEMRTGLQEGVLQAAVAHAFDKLLADVQRCQLLLGDLDEVAVLAKHDALATATFRLFHPVQCMLASPVETPADAAAVADGRTFWAEDKLDGIRAQIHKSPDGVALYTRDLARIDAAFPDVAAAVAALPGAFLLDGEIVPYRNGCVLPFAHIQKRLGRKKVSAKVLADYPAAFIAFDMLYRDGALLTDVPLRERRNSLRELAAGSALLVSEAAEVATAEQVAAAFDAARGRRNEGIVLKDPLSPYSPGRRGKNWLKLKTHLPTLDCVVTAAETGHGKRRQSLSDYTFAVWDREPAEEGARLVNVGKAYSGVTDEEIAQLTELFTKLTTQQFGRVRLVKPQVVLEIACDTIQQSARHASGFALRFPRIKRIRWDKGPADADRLARVAELFQSTANFAQAASAPKGQEDVGGPPGEDNA